MAQKLFWKLLNGSNLVAEFNLIVDYLSFKSGRPLTFVANLQLEVK